MLVRLVAPADINALQLPTRITVEMMHFKTSSQLRGDSSTAQQRTHAASLYTRITHPRSIESKLDEFEQLRAHDAVELVCGGR